METHAVTAAARSTTGKGAARKSRKAGQTPGVLYRAGGSATPINFDVAELAAVFRKTADPNTVVSLTFDGSARTCLIREIQRHPVSRTVVHVDFYEIDADYPVTVSVAIRPVGRAVGTRAGGTLRVLARRLTVKCPAGSIPSHLDVDVTDLDVGRFIKASQVPAPAGVAISFAQDFNVLTVQGKLADVPVEVAPAAAAAVPAAGAAAPAAGAPAKADKDDKKKK